MDQIGPNRKIQISKSDLQYIHTNLLNRIHARLNVILPQSSTTTTIDPLKTEVSNLLQKFLLNSLDKANNSLLIDGRQVHSLSKTLSSNTPENIEPFNNELNKQLRKVVRDVEKETITVSKMRKECPKLIRKGYKQVAESTDMKLTKYLQEQELKLQEQKQKQDMEDDNDDDEVDYEELKDDYVEHVNRLDRVKNGLPGLKAEFDQIDQTISFLDSEYEKCKELRNKRRKTSS